MYVLAIRKTKEEILYFSIHGEWTESIELAKEMEEKEIDYLIFELFKEKGIRGMKIKKETE